MSPRAQLVLDEMVLTLSKIDRGQRLDDSGNSEIDYNR